MFKHLNSKTWIVGGNVRDELMGIIPNDIDYCIECTEEELRTVFPTIEKVGKSFPVFLHPVTGDEIALTRTEKSTGNSYNDFEVTEVGVSISEDLFRRDLTINMIAKNYETGELYDPYNGIDDLKNKIIRIINKDSLSDDPLRILRIFRFAGRFDFKIDDKTQQMIHRNVHRLEHIPGERVLLELEKVWEQFDKPSKFFKLMKQYCALPYHFKYLNECTEVPAGPFQYHFENSVFDHTMEVIDRIKEAGGNFRTFIAGLTHDFGKLKTDWKTNNNHHYGHEYLGLDIISEFLDDIRVPTVIKKFALFCSKNHMKAHVIHKMRDIKLAKFAKNFDKKYFDDYLIVVNADHVLTVEQKDAMMLVRELKNVKFDKDHMKNVKDKEREVIKILVSKLKEMKK